MSNKKYSLSYQLLEKKEINAFNNNQDQKIIEESTIIDLRRQVNQILINENYAGTIDNITLPDIADLSDRALSGLKKLANSVSMTLSGFLSKLKSEPDTYSQEFEKAVNIINTDASDTDDSMVVDTDLQSVLDELNSEEYEFDIQIPGIVNRKISLDFASAVALLFIYKNHNPQIIVLEAKDIMSNVYNSRNMQDFTCNLLNWLKDKSSKISTIGIESGRKKVPKLFQEIVDKANDGAATTFYTGMSTKMGYLLEDVMQEVLYKSKHEALHGKDSYTSPTIKVPSNSQAKMALIILLILKSSDKKQLKISGGKIAFKGSAISKSFGFFSSRSFDDISKGNKMRNNSYTADVLEIVLNSNCKILETGIENAIKEANVLLESPNGKVGLKDIQVRTGTDEIAEVKGHPAFDFAIQDNDSKEYCFIDLKSANDSSTSRNDIGVSGSNKDNFAIKSLKNLAIDNELISKDNFLGPKYLGILKAIYTVYLQDSSAKKINNDLPFINVVECKTLYGTVTASCTKSVLEREKKKNKTDSKGKKRKSFFHIDCDIEFIDNLKGNTEKSVFDNISSNDEIKKSIIDHIQSNREIIDEVLPTYSDFNKKINRAKKIFNINEVNGKLVISGFKQEYYDNINFDSIPKFYSSNYNKPELDKPYKKRNKYSKEYADRVKNLFIYSDTLDTTISSIRSSVEFLFSKKIEDYTVGESDLVNQKLFNLNKTFFSNSNKIKILILILEGMDKLRDKHGDWISVRFGSTLSNQIYKTFKLNETEAGDLQNKLKFRVKRKESNLIIKEKTKQFEKKNKPTKSIPWNVYRTEYSDRNIRSYIEQLKEFEKNDKINLEKTDDNLEDQDTSLNTSIPVQSTGSIVSTSSQKVDSYNRKGRVLREVYSHLFRK